MKPGDRVLTYNHDDTRTVVADLISRDDDPDYSELIDCGDVSREITSETTQMERWKIHFVGDPDNHTSMRWIHPRQMFEKQPANIWIYVTTLFGGPNEHWLSKQIVKYINPAGKIRLTVEHLGAHCRDILTAKTFDDDAALDTWLKMTVDDLDVIPDNQLSTAAVIQQIYTDNDSDAQKKYTN